MITNTMTRKAASASEELRLEPTALPTRVFRFGRETLGWHPVVTPVLARVPA